MSRCSGRSAAHDNEITRISQTRRGCVSDARRWAEVNHKPLDGPNSCVGHGAGCRMLPIWQRAALQSEISQCKIHSKITALNDRTENKPARSTALSFTG